MCVLDEDRVHMSVFQILIRKNSGILDSLNWALHRILVYMNSLHNRIKNNTEILGSWIASVAHSL